MILLLTCYRGKRPLLKLAAYCCCADDGLGHGGGAERTRFALPVAMRSPLLPTASDQKKWLKKGLQLASSATVLGQVDNVQIALGLWWKPASNLTGKTMSSPPLFFWSLPLYAGAVDLSLRGQSVWYSLWASREVIFQLGCRTII